MPVRASIEPLTWENAFFGVNSAIVRITSEAPLLTPDALAPWSRVQAKIAASNTGELDALQQLGFSLVEGEVDLALPVNNASDSGAVVAQETDIPALRQLASAAFAQSRFRAPWYAPDASSRFYAQWIENAVRGTFDHQCLILRAASGDIRGYVSLRAKAGQADGSFFWRIGIRTRSSNQPPWVVMVAVPPYLVAVFWMLLTPKPW